MEGVATREAAHPAGHGLLLFFTLIRRLNSLQNGIQKIIFRQRAFERLLTIDHRLGHGLDAILGDKIGKFSGFNTVGRDVFALHCKLVGQADRLRTVGSGGSDKHFKMDRLAQAAQLLFAFRPQAGFAF